MAPATVEPGDTGVSRPSMVTMASPGGTPVSNTRSAHPEMVSHNSNVQVELTDIATFDLTGVGLVVSKVKSACSVEE